MPYTVQIHASTVGPRHWAHYPDGFTRLLTTDEVKVWEHVQTLQAKLDELATPATTNSKPKK